MTDFRIARRSSDSTSGTKYASSVGSSPKKPSTPSRMISVRPPTRRARTGVPQASASIAASPNGSGHDPGISAA